jgi:hypothetical protein
MMKKRRRKRRMERREGGLETRVSIYAIYLSNSFIACVFVSNFTGNLFSSIDN